MAMVAGRKPPASTPYLAQRHDAALSLTIGCSTDCLVVNGINKLIIKIPSRHGC